jgi:hypothetical protein
MLSSSQRLGPSGGIDRRSDAAAIDPITRYGIILAVILLYAVSGGLLWYAGYNYDGLSGSAVTKLHPATYMAILVFLWRACAYGNPVAYGVMVAGRRPACMLMVVISVTVLLSIILRQKPGMAGHIDTFVGPGLLVLLLAEADDRLTATLRNVVHVVMTINALMALGEFFSHTLIFPYRFDGAAFETDTRSSALQGHPLANATLTACYVLALFSGDTALSRPKRMMMIGLQFAALVTFGGRSAIVASLVLGGAYTIFHGFQALRDRRISLLGAALGIILLSLLPALAAGLISSGFFDALIARFFADGGSANARVEMLQLFDYFSLAEIIVGPDLDTLESLRRINGLEWGIENPIVRMTLYQGAFITLLMTLGFALFMRELTSRSERGTWLPMIGWLLLINTQESVASKTTLMAKFAVIILCLYPQRRS